MSSASGLSAANVSAQLKKAAEAQEYQLPDGTRVKRASLTELNALRKDLAYEEANPGGQGALVPVAFCEI